MKWDFKKELFRKIFHFLTISILFIYFILVDVFNRKFALLILVLILIFLLKLEYFRIEIRKKIPILHYIYKFRREKEKNKIGSDVFFLIGAILVLAIFDFKIAIAAILITIFGDMVAALVGKGLGKRKLKSLKNRTWEGIIAEFIVDFIIVFLIFFWGFWNDYLILYNLKFWMVVLVMSISATFIETIVYKIDDNFFIPVFSGFLGEIIILFS
ncbi:MAG: CTP--2,3-di-O-geranylgeranyl-sn-glycero-1-phosphate cytidyltransferase [Candidatus Pacearchaeota archaeon]